MSDVSFNEHGQEYIASASQAGKPPFFTGLVMNMGLAKTPKGAEKVLLVAIALFILIGIGAAVLGSGVGKPPPEPPPDFYIAM